MSNLNRSQITRGPAIVTWGGHTFFTEADFKARHEPAWENVETSMYGAVTKWKKDLIITIPIRLWGAYENLSTLFPAAAGFGQATSIGAGLFGASDLPLVILGRNGDQITYTNAQITKLTELYLGVNSNLFAADLVFTCLIGYGKIPTDSGAYYAIATGQTYADNAFATTNYKRCRFTGAWGGSGTPAGFSTPSFFPKEGVKIGYEYKLEPDGADGYGTMDMIIADFHANATCIPLGPTMAQIDAQSQTNADHGTLLEAIAYDLVLTGSNSGPVITLKNASMTKSGFAFGIKPSRNDEVMWETNRIFASGAPSTIATVA